MSYGLEAVGLGSSGEPFYSSVRHKPNDWTIGVAGEREVERVFHETVPVAVRSSEAPYRAEQYARTISARWTGRDTLRVTWPEPFRRNARAAVALASADGANDWYHWRFEWNTNPPVLTETSADNVMPVLDSAGGSLGVDISGLRPAGGYRMSVLGPSRCSGESCTQSLRSDVLHLKPPGRASGSPTAPSNVGATVTGPDSVRLTWRDNSRVETGFEVWYRKWSGEDPDDVWRRDGEPLPARTRSAETKDLAAKEEIRITDAYWDSKNQVLVEGKRAMRGRYSFAVVAYNDKGFSASETFDLEFMPGPPPEPTASGNVTDCALRPTGIDLDGYQVLACLETPDGPRGGHGTTASMRTSPGCCTSSTGTTRRYSSRCSTAAQSTATAGCSWPRSRLWGSGSRSGN